MNRANGTPETSRGGPPAGILLVIDVIIRAVGALAGVGAIAFLVERFGIGEDFDSYFWAWTIPQFFSGAIALSIAHIVLPGLSEVHREGGRGPMYDCLGPLFYWSLIVPAGVAVLAALLLAYAEYSLGRYVGLALEMVPWLLAAVALDGTARVLAAALRVRGKPAGHAVMPLVTAICIVATVIMLGGSRGIVAAAIGCAIGGAVKVALAFGLCFADGFRLRAKLFGPARARAMLDAAHHPAGTGLGAEAHVVIERLLGSLLGPGYVAVLGIVDTVARAVEAVPTGIIAASAELEIVNVAAIEDQDSLTRSIRRKLRRMALFLLPVAVAAALAGRPLAGILFGGQGSWLPLLGWMLTIRLAGTFFGATTGLLILVPEQTGHLAASAKVVELTAATRAVLMSALVVPYGAIGMAIGMTAASAVSVGIALAIAARIGYPILHGPSRPSPA